MYYLVPANSTNYDLSSAQGWAIDSDLALHAADCGMVQLENGNFADRDGEEWAITEKGETTKVSAQALEEFNAIPNTDHDSRAAWEMAHKGELYVRATFTHIENNIPQYTRTVERVGELHLPYAHEMELLPEEAARPHGA